jgi:hypothetical protein
MKQVQVRCWKESICGPDASPGDIVFISSTEGHLGYDFYQCAECGEIYARSLMSIMYAKSDPFENVACVTCSRMLSQSLHSYPENYLKKDGTIGQFEVSYKILSDEASIVLEFYGFH